MRDKGDYIEADVELLLKPAAVTPPDTPVVAREGDADVWSIITEVAATTCWDKNSGKIGGPTECDWCQRCRAKRLLEERTPRFIGSPNALRKAAMDIATRLAGEYIDRDIALTAIPHIESVLANFTTTTAPDETTVGGTLAHVDFVFDNMQCCKVCGLVRPAEGWTRPCKGPSELSLRSGEGEGK